MMQNKQSTQQSCFNFNWGLIYYIVIAAKEQSFLKLLNCLGISPAARLFLSCVSGLTWLNVCCAQRLLWETVLYHIDGSCFNYQDNIWRPIIVLLLFWCMPYQFCVHRFSFRRQLLHSGGQIVEWYVFTGPDQSFAKSPCGYGFWSAEWGRLYM